VGPTLHTHPCLHTHTPHTATPANYLRHFSVPGLRSAWAFSWRDDAAFMQRRCLYGLVVWFARAAPRAARMPPQLPANATRCAFLLAKLRGSARAPRPPLPPLRPLHLPPTAAGGRRLRPLLACGDAVSVGMVPQSAAVVL